MTVPVVTHARARCSCGASGGSGDCACSADAYQPYCIEANTDDASTVILATSPFSYYLMDVNGAADISGNGHTGISSIGTVTYGVAAITSKALEATRYTNGGSIAFPPPVADMGNPAQAFAVAMVMQVDDYDSVGGNSALDGGFPFLSWAGTSPPKMAHVIGATGHLCPFSDSTFARLGNFVRSRDVLFALGEPHVLILNAPAAVNSLGTWEFWLDGVLVLTSQREGTGTDGTSFQIGRIAGGGPFFGAIDMTYSNLATWARGLTEAEIRTITEVLIDDAIIATAWVPS